MKFKNARPEDKSTYRVSKMEADGKECYCLRRFDSYGREIPITITNDDLNSLILYKE